MMIHVLVLLGRAEHEADVIATVGELLKRGMGVEVVLGGGAAPAALIDLQVPLHAEHEFLEGFIQRPGRKVFLDPIGPVPGNMYGAPIARLMMKFGIPVMLFERVPDDAPAFLAMRTADRVAVHAARGVHQDPRPETAPDGRPIVPEMGYERYVRLMGLAGAIKRGFDGPFSVLDVGGEDDALRRFIPQARYTSHAGFITRREPAPQDDASHDVVVAADVLEHVLPGDREAFLRELIRVARRRVVFSFPQKIAEPHEAFVLTLLPDHRWLKEHQENGLPDPAEVEAVLRGLGTSFTSTPNHSLTSWVYSVAFDHQSMDQDTRKDMNAFMQMENFGRESAGDCYRVIYVVER